MKVNADFIFCDEESMKLPTEEKILKDYYSDYKDENEARMHYSCDLCGPYLDVIRWHPYPDEKPKGKTGYYLVSVDLGNGIHVRTDHYTDGSVMLDGRWNEGFVVCGTKPIAWAELPKPFVDGD